MSLKELNDFQKYKQFIKRFFIEDEDLWKLVYYSDSMPLSKEVCENPYKIFTTEKEDENDNHGVVLFKQKNPEILNYGTTIILVDFESARLGNSVFFDNLYIVFRLIGKSSDIEEVKDNEGNIINRLATIAESIDNNFNLANINKIGEIKRQSLNPLSINEENCGYTIIYSVREWSNNLSENKNYLKRKYGSPDGN